MFLLMSYTNFGSFSNWGRASSLFHICAAGLGRTFQRAASGSSTASSTVPRLLLSGARMAVYTTTALLGLPYCVHTLEEWMGEGRNIPERRPLPGTAGADVTRRKGTPTTTINPLSAANSTEPLQCAVILLGSSRGPGSGPRT